MTRRDANSFAAAERATAWQTPMCTEGFWAGADSGSNAHGIGDIDVFAVNVCLADPVDGLTGGRFVKGILKCADVHLRPIEVGQMQDRSACLASNILRLTPVARPIGPTTGRVAFSHFGPYLVVIGPIARYLNTTRWCAGSR